VGGMGGGDESWSGFRAALRRRYHVIRPSIRRLVGLRLRAENKSPKTIESYRFAVSLALEFAGGNSDSSPDPGVPRRPTAAPCPATAVARHRGLTSFARRAGARGGGRHVADARDQRAGDPAGLDARPHR
jgi:hypothetical protein